MNVVYKNPRYVEAFFDKWSEEMAYIVGYFAADGSIYRNKGESCYLAFYSVDLELIKLVKKILKVPNKITLRQRNHAQTSYTIQIGSKNIFDRLLSLGFTPNKSLKLKLPNIPDGLFCHFLRGYFDGDGGLYFQKLIRKDRPRPSSHLHLNIRCISQIFLENLRTRIAELTNIKGGSIYFHSRAYSLAYYGKDVIELYSFLYPNQEISCLSRKRRQFEEGIKAMGP